MSKAGYLIKTIGLIAIGRVSTQIVALALLPIYTTYLAPGEYGIVDLLLTYVTLLSPVFTLQIEFGTLRFLIAERSSATETKKTITTALIAMLGLAVVWLGAGLILATVLDERIILYFLALLASSMSFSVMSQLARGLGRNRLYALASIIVAISTLLTVYLFVAIGKFDFDVYFWIIPACSLAGTLVLAAGTSVHVYFRPRAFDLQALRRLIRYSTPLIPNSLSWWVINASGRTVAAVFLGVSYVGVYAVAMKFASMVTGVSTIFSYAWMESASLHIDAPDRPQFFSRVVNAALRVFTALTVLIIGFMPIAFPILVADAFSDAYQYIPVLLLGSLGNAMVSFYSGVLLAQQDTKRVATTSIMVAIVSIAVSLSLVTFIGLYAVAAGSAIAFVSLAVYRHLMIRSSLGIRYSSATLLIVLSALAVTLVAYYVPVSPWLPATIGVLCAIVLTSPQLVELVKNIRGRR